MHNICKSFYVLLLCILACHVSSAQEAPAFYSDIRAFKKQDSIKFPPARAILFVGSSSFTNWRDIHKYFPAYPIINRGFGGSSLPDVIRYANEIIVPYRPKQVIIYCGENDLAASDTVSASTVSARFRDLFRLIRRQLPGVLITYVSMKPSAARRAMISKMIMANAQIETFLLSERNTSYIDVYHEMLNTDGTPVKDLFVQDSLHMNAKGYHIWQKVIEPYLLK